MLSIKFKTVCGNLLPMLFFVTYLFPLMVVAKDWNRSSVQQALDNLNKLETLSPNQQADQQLLTETITLLDNIDKEETKTKNQAQRLRNLPSELKEFGAKLDALIKGKNPEQLKSEYATMSLTELNSLQQQVLANMQEAQEALGIIGSQVTALQTLE